MTNKHLIQNNINSPWTIENDKYTPTSSNDHNAPQNL